MSVNLIIKLYMNCSKWFLRQITELFFPNTRPNCVSNDSYSKCKIKLLFQNSFYVLFQSTALYQRNSTFIKTLSRITILLLHVYKCAQQTLHNITTSTCKYILKNVSPLIFFFPSTSDSDLTFLFRLRIRP